MDSLRVRKAHLEDAPILLDLTDQLGYKLSLSKLVANMNDYLEDVEKALWVAIFEENIVGYIAIDMAQTFHREGKHARVVSLVIDRLHRRLGIGKFLLEAAQNWTKEQGCWVLELTSSSRRQKEGTHDFYLEYGFIKDSSQAYFHKLLSQL